MNRRITLLLAAVMLLALTGCSSIYQVHLKDGTVVYSKGRPDYIRKSGFYRFKDLSGKKVQVNKDRVVKIEQK